LPALLLHGENNYLLRQTIDCLQKKFVKSEGDLNLIVFNARKKTADEIITAAETPPFLGNQRLVIVHDFDFKKTTDSLIKFISDVPNYTTLVLTTPKPDARTKLFKVFKKNGAIQEFALLKPAEFRIWLRNTAKNHSVELQPAALELLATFTLGNCEAAINELSKLKIYANGEKITQLDVEKLVHPDLHTSVFRLTDAIGIKQTNNALVYLHDIVNRNENLIQIFFMIVRQFRILLSLNSLAAQNLPPATIAKQLKLHPFVVQNSLRQVRNFSISELIKAHQKLLEIDIAIKSGKIRYSSNDPSELTLELEKFIIGFA